MWDSLAWQLGSWDNQLPISRIRVADLVMTPETPSGRRPFQESSRSRAGISWAEYLEEFHDGRPGITEDVLARSHRRGLTPYAWIAEPLPKTGVVLDLACGSAPLCSAPRARPLGRHRSLVGRTRSRRSWGAGPLVRADATALPFATGRFRRGRVLDGDHAPPAPRRRPCRNPPCHGGRRDLRLHAPWIAATASCRPSPVPPVDDRRWADPSGLPQRPAADPVRRAPPPGRLRARGR